jgi:hypothetical protein
LVAHAAPQHQHLAISRFIAELHIRSHLFGIFEATPSESLSSSHVSAAPEHGHLTIL